MAKVLVTGGAGFIGCNLVDELVNRNYEVVVVDNLLRGNKLHYDTLNKITLVKDDIRNGDVMMQHARGCEVIFHLAAILGVDIVADNPIECMDTEIIGMKNVVEAALTYKTKNIVYASTSGVYGHSAIEQAVNEDIQLDAKTSYAIAKRYNEIYLKALYEEKHVNSISLRFFNVYGSRQDDRMVIPRFFKQAMNNEPIMVYGTGEQTRDFTYIDDCVNSIIDASIKGKGNLILNVSHEKETSINELAHIIKEMTNSKSEIVYIQPSSKRYDFEVERRIGDSTRLQNLIGYKPDTDLMEGLKKYYDELLATSD